MSRDTLQHNSNGRRIVGICYNGNSLFLLSRFAVAQGASLNCYVPPSLHPLAKHLGIATLPLRYGMVLTDLMMGVLRLRVPLIALPHTGGRFLSLLRSVFQVRFFVDDGFLCLGFDHFLRPTDTVITFADIAEFKRADVLNYSYECPASLIDYAQAIQHVPAPLLDRPTHVIVSSSELDTVALQRLLNEPPAGSELRYIPHPREYKNSVLFSNLQPIQPLVPYGTDAVILKNLQRITGVTIGRSFTSYLLTAYLVSHGSNAILEIHRPPVCTGHFVEMHRFCTWLSEGRTR